MIVVTEAGRQGFGRGQDRDNRYLAVWVGEHGGWKFVAYQPTPIIDG